jgi:hypothetical protein
MTHLNIGDGFTDYLTSSEKINHYLSDLQKVN